MPHTPDSRLHLLHLDSSARFGRGGLEPHGSWSRRLSDAFARRWRAVRPDDGYTHRDLAALIREGRFREDLFYRINVARIDVPPLRERREDIPALVDHFLSVLAQEEAQPKRSIEPDALRRLFASCAGALRSR